MRRLAFLSILLLTIHGHAKQSYQDLIINNKVKQSGIRLCPQRYEAIKKALDTYNGPFSVLDIGAAEGYFSFRIAHDYNAPCTMLEYDAYRSLTNLCNQNSSINNKLTLLEKRFSVADFRTLGYQEHFDVVLCLNVIHWFTSQWKEAIDSVVQLGNFVIIETPPAGEKKTHGTRYHRQINDYLKNHYKGQLIGHFQRHTSPHLYSNMYLIQSPNKKSAGGISLTTFNKFNGTFPSRNSITSYLNKINKRASKKVIIKGRNNITAS